MAEMAARLLGYGVRVHSNLRAVVILENTEWAAQQVWVAEISVAHCNILLKYRYNHSHYADSIREVLRILATADAMRYRRKAKAPGELADMFSQGIKRLQQLVHKQTEPPHYQSESNKESANSATTTDSKGPAPRRGQRKHKEK